MAMRYLGPEFDIHTGGIDNVFPHHEDEIAQSASLSGRVPARHWVHGEHLLQAGRKMAKSAGNLERITDLVADGIDPLAFRYLALQNRYRHKLAYSRTSVRAAAAGLASLRERVAALGPAPTTGPWVPPAPMTAPAAGPRPTGIARGMAGHGGDGLEPRARMATGRMSHSRRSATRAGGSTGGSSTRSTTTSTWRPRSPSCDRSSGPTCSSTSGAGSSSMPIASWGSTSAARPRGRSEWDARPDAGSRLIAERGTARRVAGDYGRADAIRVELQGLGVEITDDPDGTSHWRRTTR